MSNNKLIIICILLQNLISINANPQLLDHQKPYDIKQTEPLKQFQFDFSKEDFYYNIILQKINLSLNDQKSSLYLKVFVTSFQIDDTFDENDPKNRGQIYQDYDGFGTKSDTQIIKFKQKGNKSIFISCYLYDKNKKITQYNQQEISAIYSIKIEEQSQKDYCEYPCQSGLCNLIKTGCDCQNFIGKFYFDKQCKYFSKDIEIDDEKVERMYELVQYYNIDIFDFDTSHSLLITTSHPENRVSYQVYDPNYSSYTIPNFINEDTFQTSQTQEFRFNYQWIQSSASKLKQPKSIKIVFAVYNMNIVSVTVDDMPRWSLYLFAALAILGVIFMLSIIFVVIKGQIRGSNSRRVRIRALFITTDIVEKYMPQLLYKEINIKKEDNEECTICLEGYKDEDLVRISICGHIYHIDCIDKWLIAHTNCPYCRQELTEKELEAWLQRKIQEQLQRQEQKELQNKMIEYIQFIQNNENIKNILKQKHYEEKTKRSFLSISNNNANLKKNFNDHSSISSKGNPNEKTTVSNKIQQDLKNSNLSKNNKQKYLHSKSFNIGEGIDVNIRDLVLDDIQSIKKSQLIKYNNTEQQKNEDDFNFNNNLFYFNTEKSEILNLQTQKSILKKNQSNHSNCNLIEQSESNDYFKKKQSLNSNNLKTIQEDFKPMNLRDEQDKESYSQLNNDVKSKKNEIVFKRTQISHSSFKSIESNHNKIKTIQNFDVDQESLTDKQEKSSTSENNSSLQQKEIPSIQTQLQPTFFKQQIKEDDNMQLESFNDKIQFSFQDGINIKQQIENQIKQQVN